MGVNKFSSIYHWQRWLGEGRCLTLGCRGTENGGIFQQATEWWPSKTWDWLGSLSDHWTPAMIGYPDSMYGGGIGESHSTSIPGIFVFTARRLNSIMQCDCSP